MPSRWVLVCAVACSERPSTASRSLGDADARVVGGARGDRIGDVLAAADLDGDGIDDLVLGAPAAGRDQGRVHVVPGPIAGEVELPDPVLDGDLYTPDEDVYYYDYYGTEGQIRVGESVAAGDVDGDGANDLVVGAPDVGSGRISDYTARDPYGVVYVLHGPVTAQPDPDAVETKLVGEPGTSAGGAVAIVGDVDGDGAPDVLVGAPHSVDGGEAFLVAGPVVGVGALDQARAHLFGEASAGGALASGDLDGDGLSDIVLGAPGADDVGAVYVLRGPVAGERDLDTADATWTGEYLGGELGAALTVADLDGDGSPDLLVGAPGQFEAALVLPGAAIGAQRSRDAVATLESILEREAGASVAAADFDGDGFVDALVGAPGAGPGAHSHMHDGAALLVYGPVAGTIAWAEGGVELVGGASGHAGTAVTSGDLDADGLPDAVVGAPGDSVTGADAGVAYILSSTAL